MGVIILNVQTPSCVSLMGSPSPIAIQVSFYRENPARTRSNESAVSNIQNNCIQYILNPPTLKIILLRQPRHQRRLPRMHTPLNLPLIKNMPLIQVPCSRNARPHSPNGMFLPDGQNGRRPGTLPRETERRPELATDFRFKEFSEEDGEGKDAGDDNADVDFGDSGSLVY